MGVRSAATLCDRLIAAGADAETPAVIVENGSLSSERAVACRLADVGGAIAGLGIKGPAIIFVGLDWADAGLSRPDKIESYKVVEDGRPGMAPDSRVATPAQQG